MLDYAANAVLYWPVETLSARFEKTCESQKLDPANELASFLQGAEAESFWQTAKTNLQAGRIRLVFVADEIPPELRRVVEFLNGQMDPAEVLAVEVKQYIGEGKMKTLVPRLMGQTTRRPPPGPASGPKKIDEVRFLSELRESRGMEECEVAKRIVDWAATQKLRADFNKWQQSSSFIPGVEVRGSRRYPISIQTNGSLWVQMRWLRESPPFNDEFKRHELWQKLNEIPGTKIPPERMTGYPQILLRDLQDPAALERLLNTLTWVVGELQSAPA